MDDAIGLVANATKDGTEVQNDFDNIAPWSGITSYNYDTVGRKITALFGEPNYDPTGVNGQVLTGIPNFYWRIWEDETYRYYSITKEKVNNYIFASNFSLGRYTNSGSASGVYSRSGYAPFVNYNINQAISYCKNVGTGFDCLDYHIFLIQLLYIVEYANYNSQEVLGQGNVNNTQPLTSGGCDALGMRSGCLVNDGKHSVIYRGLEDIFGNVWQFIAGINIKDRVTYISYNSGDYTADKFDGSYKALGYTNAASNGWIKALGYNNNNPLIILPIAISDDASSYMRDYYWQDAGNRIVRFGGAWGSGGRGGLWCWHLGSMASWTSGDGGSRLLFNQ